MFRHLLDGSGRDGYNAVSKNSRLVGTSAGPVNTGQQSPPKDRSRLPA
jgi:hypothetical protein